MTNAVSDHTRKYISPKWPKTAPFTAFSLRMTINPSVIVDAISVKNVVTNLTRLDIVLFTWYVIM